MIYVYFVSYIILYSRCKNHAALTIVSAPRVSYLKWFDITLPGSWMAEIFGLKSCM